MLTSRHVPKETKCNKIMCPEAKSLNGYELRILPVGLVEHILKHQHTVEGETKACRSQVHCIRSQGDEWQA